ncbi:MAG: thiamine phosphate synthase [Acutalibacteraceae bacterium]
MKLKKEHLLLYAVTDRSWLGDNTLLQQIEMALRGGVTCVQLREKRLSKEEFLNEAFAVKELCSKYNVPLIINDDVEIAVKCKADGVHVGQGDMSAKDARIIAGNNMIIGVSARTVQLAVKAQADGADYLGVGAVFGTSTKADAMPLSQSTLKEICSAVSIPVVAIGGINRNNINMLCGTGISGAAVVSGIFASENITEECKLLLNECKKAVAL